MTDPTPLVRNTAPNDDTDRPARATGASPSLHGGVPPSSSISSVAGGTNGAPSSSCSPDDDVAGKAEPFMIDHSPRKREEPNSAALASCPGSAKKAQLALYMQLSEQVIAQPSTTTPLLEF